MKWHSTLVRDEEVRDFMKSCYYYEFNENNDFIVELQALQNDLPKGIKDNYLLWRVCKGESPVGLTDWGSFATTADEADPYFVFANQINDFAQKWHLPNIDGSPDVCHSITSNTPNPRLTPSTLIFDPNTYSINMKIADVCHSDDGGELKRVGRPNCVYVFTASQPFNAELIMSARSDFRAAWVWEKNIASNFLNANRGPLKAHEDIVVFCARAPKYNPQFMQAAPYERKRNGADDTGDCFGSIAKRKPSQSHGQRYPRTVVRFDKETGLHPTQKPVTLMAYLILTYSNPGDTILDPFAGSGTTGVACLNEGRDFIGIELNPTYAVKARQRLLDAVKQPTLTQRSNNAEE